MTCEKCGCAIPPNDLASAEWMYDMVGYAWCTTCCNTWITELAEQPKKTLTIRDYSTEEV